MKRSYITMGLLSFLLFSCQSENENQGKSSGITSEKKPGKQLNISILWDLSDRIDPGKHKELPSHSERDIAILKYFADYFKADMDKKGAYFSKGKLKVFFSPNPTDRNINALASQLAVDLSAKDIKEKKLVYDNISSTFQQTGQKIAETSIQTSNWQGADIYRFFKNNVVDYCVTKDSNYKNILVVITDGYVYDKNSIGKKGNRSEYILPSLFSSLGLRDNQNLQSVFKAKNCGLIATRDDLDKLEILVLEVNSEENHKNDEDIIKLYLQKWFTDMKVKHFEIYNTDLPENVEKHIADFMN